jgi:hypothetical protein
MEVFVSYHRSVIESSFTSIKIQDIFADAVEHEVKKRFPKTKKCWAVWYQFPKRRIGPSVLIFDAGVDPVNTQKMIEEISQITITIAHKIEEKYLNNATTTQIH